MNGWLVSWLRRWLDELKAEWIDGCIDVSIDGWYGAIDRQLTGKISIRRDG